jgi:hypothetical protein
MRGRLFKLVTASAARILDLPAPDPEWAMRGRLLWTGGTHWPAVSSTLRVRAWAEDGREMWADVRPGEIRALHVRDEDGRDLYAGERMVGGDRVPADVARPHFDEALRAAHRLRLAGAVVCPGWPVRTVVRQPDWYKLASQAGVTIGDAPDPVTALWGSRHRWREPAQRALCWAAGCLLHGHAAEATSWLIEAEGAIARASELFAPPPTWRARS